jgi:hypothetical protein
MIRTVPGGKLPAYRLYHVDGAGKVSSAEWIEADTDDSAIETARSNAKTVECELWQGSRLVARIDGNTQP